MGVGLTIVVVVGMFCATAIVISKMGQSSLTRSPLALTAYAKAKCKTGHADETACIPLWDGKDYFCPYRGAVK